MASSETLEARLGYRFANQDLLLEALTHASVSDQDGIQRSNERLEFLGDRVLGLVIADWLSRAFPMTGEEGLAPRLNALVNRIACAQVGARLGLGDHMRLAKSEQKSDGRGRDTVLADACEAVIAAIYLDGGLEAARAMIEREWADAFASVEIAPVDPKTALQEWAAARRMGLPSYHVIGRSGPDHAPLFRVRVAIAGLGEAEGEGGAKRDAERAAARALMAQVHHDG